MDKKIYQALLDTFNGELIECHNVLTQTLLLLETAKKTELSEHLDTLFRTAHNLKGAAKSVSLDTIAEMAHKLENQFSTWRDKKHKPTQSEITEALTLSDRLIEIYSSETDQGHHASEILKIPLTRIEEANVKADEFITYQLRFERGVQQLLELQEHLNSAQLTDTGINRLAEDSKTLMSDFSRALSALQTDLREMRLIPIHTVLNPLKRSARDLSKQMHKAIQLTIEGGDIEIDKVILDALKDPLQHLMRNAVDHAIETEEERLRANKPREGKILIRVSQESGKIKLVFKDDGRGIDVQEIKTKALQDGLLTSKEAKELSDKALILLITNPGFSTRDKVSEISGRGVGLDAVMDNLQKIKAKLDIETKLGEGTTFTILLPLTLATTRGLFVQCNTQSFMLPSLSLNGPYDISVDEVKSVGSDSVVVLNKRTLPVRYLADLLQLDTKLEDRKFYQGIELGELEQTFLLLFDQIDDEHDCVIKPMVYPFNQIALYMGVTLTATNQLIPVLSPKALLQLAQSYQLTPRKLNNQQEEKNQAKRILVVDDSFTTRSLAANALRAAGYEVDTANDGQAAWEALQKAHYDCVITDIEMPRMDGFELTALIKSKDKLKSIPILMVSSHELEEEKQRGIEAGAEAYLEKSQFTTHLLIEKLESFL